MPTSPPQPLLPPAEPPRPQSCPALPRSGCYGGASPGVHWTHVLCLCDAAPASTSPLGAAFCQQAAATSKHGSTLSSLPPCASAPLARNSTRVASMIPPPFSVRRRCGTRVAANSNKLARTFSSNGFSPRSRWPRGGRLGICKCFPTQRQGVVCVLFQSASVPGSSASRALASSSPGTWNVTVDRLIAAHIHLRTLT